MVLKNFAFMSGLSIFRSAVQLGVNVILAFFVSPAQYGLVAFSVPFTVLISMFTDLGMSSALVRMENLDRKTAGAALTLLISVGAALSGLLLLIAPLIGYGVKMPGLSGVLVGMTVGAFLSIVAIAPRAMLERKLQYPKIAFTECFAVMAAALVAVGLMIAGAGVWAIVLLTIINNALRAIIFLVFSRDSISLSFEWRRCIGIVKFGSWILLSNLVTFFARNFDNLLLGAVLGAASVGLYGLAYQFMMIPMIALTWPASGVLLATLSQGRFDADQREDIVLATIGLTAAITFPVMICLLLVFPEIESNILSHKWHGISDILKWLAPLGALQSIASYNGTILQVAGRARAQFIFAVLNTAIVMIMCVIGIHWGLMGMVRAVALSGAILSFGFIALMVNVARLDWYKLAVALVPAGCASVAAIVFDKLFHVFSVEIPNSYLVLAPGLLLSILAIDILFLRRFKLWAAILSRRRNSPEYAL